VFRGTGASAKRVGTSEPDGRELCVGLAWVGVSDSPGSDCRFDGFPRHKVKSNLRGFSTFRQIGSRTLRVASLGTYLES